VNGHFKCLGSIQHLKNKYGDGYSIRIRLDLTKEFKSTTLIKQVALFMLKHLPDATLKVGEAFVYFWVSEVLERIGLAQGNRLQCFCTTECMDNKIVHLGNCILTMSRA
jgi:hypothetical protein